MSALGQKQTYLRRCGHSPITSHGHPRQDHRARFTVAELICREADRNDPSRVRRSCRRIGRAAFASDLKILRKLLQHRENAPLIGQGCACLAFRSAGRTHRVACSGRWTASSIRPNLSFQYTQPTKLERRVQKSDRGRPSIKTDVAPRPESALPS